VKVDLIAASLILAAACAASSAMGQQAANGVATASVVDTPREAAAGTVPHPPVAYTPAAPAASYVAPGKSLLSLNTVLPNVEFNALSEATVQDIHLRPLYTTAIRLPHPVTTVAVGAPTLFQAEHNDQDPELVFVKPSTHDPAQSSRTSPRQDSLRPSHRSRLPTSGLSLAFMSLRISNRVRAPLEVAQPLPSSNTTTPGTVRC
jgi:hypothetical protein